MAEEWKRTSEELLAFIGESPSPWHAVESCRSRLEASGFRELNERDSWQVAPGGSYYIVRDGSSIIAFKVGDRPEAGWRIIGAHTDSPGLRLKPNAAQRRADTLCLGVEIYGGPIIASFADRDLRLAGRVWVENQGALTPRLLDTERPWARLPTPAIHLNREVNEQGLRFDPQEELYLVVRPLRDDEDPDAVFRGMLAAELDVSPEAIRSWELGVADSQPGSFFGDGDAYLASSQLDNLASCHAGLTALLEAEEVEGIAVCAFFDHEEIGSQSYKGADGRFLPDTLERVAAALDLQHEEARMRARGWLLSADMSHAYHPNFMRYYDEAHAVRLNGGPVIKINVKQRYATDGYGEAYFCALCRAEGVPYQVYSHRNNLPCGSTIGPISASRLGIRTVDIGNPMWSMHSLRESAGAKDHEMMIRVLRRFYSDRNNA